MSKIVTFEQKQMLEKLGFEYDIHQVYFMHNNSKDITRQVVGIEEIFLDEFKDNYSPIPSTASALDWVREEKGIVCYVEVIYSVLEKKTKYLGKILSESGLIIQKKTDLFDTHHLASSALLTAVLNYLIEKEK